MNRGPFILRRLAPMIPVPIGVTLVGFSLPVFAVHVTAVALLSDVLGTFLDPRVRL